MVTQRSTASSLKRAMNKHLRKTALRGPRTACGAPGHQGNDFGGVFRRMVNSQVALKGGRSTLELSVAASRVREKGGGQRGEWRAENRAARRLPPLCDFTLSLHRHLSLGLAREVKGTLPKAFGITTMLTFTSHLGSGCMHLFRAITLLLKETVGFVNVKPKRWKTRLKKTAEISHDLHCALPHK